MAQCPVTKMPNSSIGAKYKGYGASIDVDDSVAVLASSSFSPSVLVYRYDDYERIWTEEQRLPAVSPVIKVAVDDDVIAVATPFEMVNGLVNAGSVSMYRYDRLLGEWTLQQRLRSAYEDAADNFGASIVISSNQVFVGAPNDAGAQSSPRSGRVYVFEYDHLTEQWWLKEILSNPQASSSFYSGFGQSLSIQGLDLFVGEAADPLGPDGSGTVHVYEYNGTWVHTQQLEPHDPQQDDRFAESLSVFGDIAVIGSPGKDSGQGAAYVFRFNGFNWFEEQKLTEATAEDQFGLSVAANAQGVFVGALNDTTDHGSVNTYVHNIFGWVNDELITPQVANRFGASLAASFTDLLVGAPGDEHVARGAGAVYAYPSFSFPRFEMLPPTPGLANERNAFATTCAPKNRPLRFVYGTQTGSSDVPGCPGLTVGIDSAIDAGSARSDSTGLAIIETHVPASFAGQTVYYQAVDLQDCEVSRLTAFQF